MKVSYVAGAVLLALSAVACGGHNSTSPAGPSSLGGSTALTGATIQGQVQTTTGMTAATTGAAASGLTVVVVGTSLSATVSGIGQFVLSGVPEGSKELSFSGPGVNANVSFSPVQGTETIVLTVKISGNHAELETEEHENHGDLQINGTISGLTGSATSFSFIVGTKTVTGDSKTTFFGDGNRDDNFSSLHDGARVEVKAAMKNNQVYAQRIHINGGNSGNNGNDNDSDDDGDEGEGDDGNSNEVSGPIGGLASVATCPSISFVVKGTPVNTNGSTEFNGAACSSLKNGDKVQVEGTKQSSGAILASEVKKQ